MFSEVTDGTRVAEDAITLLYEVNHGVIDLSSPARPVVETWQEGFRESTEHLRIAVTLSSPGIIIIIMIMIMIIIIIIIIIIIMIMILIMITMIMIIMMIMILII